MNSTSRQKFAIFASSRGVETCMGVHANGMLRVRLPRLSCMYLPATPLWCLAAGRHAARCKAAESTMRLDDESSAVAT